MPPAVAAGAAPSITESPIGEDRDGFGAAAAIVVVVVGGGRRRGRAPATEPVAAGDGRGGRRARWSSVAGLGGAVGSAIVADGRRPSPRALVERLGDLVLLQLGAWPG